MAVNPPLIGLLGGYWSFGARVEAAAWSGDETAAATGTRGQTMAAFGLGDGALVLARAEWPGGPAVRTRDDGGVEVTPPATPSPPVSRLPAHQGKCLAVVTDPAAGGGFLSGGEDGRLLRFTADGAATAEDEWPGRPLELVAAAATGWRAVASGRQVRLIGPPGGGTIGEASRRDTLDLPGVVTALAFDPAGQRLAIAHRGGPAVRGVTVWSANPPSGDGTPIRRLAAPGQPRALAWSPDGATLIAGLQENALHAWRPAEGTGTALGGCTASEGVGSVDFAHDGSFAAAAGASRVACWRFAADGTVAPEPVECGLANRRAPVCMVACHPASALIAAGYDNGAVLLCQPGTEEALFAKPWGGGAVTALAWSRSGRRLALGTAEGEAGILLLPPGLLR